MKSIRYTTIVKKCGRPFPIVTKFTTAAYFRAVQENRVLTIHHGMGAGERDWAEVGHHIVNVQDRLVFRQPLPLAYETIVLGIHNYYADYADNQKIPDHRA